MATAIVAAIPYGTAVVSSEIISWVCNVAVAAAALTSILSCFASCCTSGTFAVADTAASFVISYIAPTIVAAIQMLYYAIKKNRGCKYTVKFLGGSSISF